MSNNSYAYKTINGIKQSVHRHIMEDHLGRELEPNEHVYHLNGDSNDNRIENLVVVKKAYDKPLKPRKKTPLQTLEERIKILESRVKVLEEISLNKDH